MNLLTTHHWEAPDRGRRGRGRARERSAETPPILRTLPEGPTADGLPAGEEPDRRLRFDNAPRLDRARSVRIVCGATHPTGPTKGSRAARKC